VSSTSTCSAARIRAELCHALGGDGLADNTLFGLRFTPLAVIASASAALPSYKRQSYGIFQTVSAEFSWIRGLAAHLGRVARAVSRRFSETACSLLFPQRARSRDFDLALLGDRFSSRVIVPVR
jgi:hypothetical protein